MLCPRCSSDNGDSRSSCWKCFAPLGDAPSSPTVIPPKAADPELQSTQPHAAPFGEQASWMTPPASTDGAAEAAQAVDDSKYVVPGLADPTAQPAAAPASADEDNSPWKNNPPAAPPPPRPAAAASYGDATSGLNWGAFLVPFWWSIAHKAMLWAAVSFFIPIVGSIYLLLKGNEVAWENREFNSVEEFRKVQKAWVIAGLVILVIQLGVFGAQFAAGLREGLKGAGQSGTDSFGGTSGYSMKGSPNGMPGMMKGGYGGPGMMKGGGMKGGYGPGAMPKGGYGAK